MYIISETKWLKYFHASLSKMQMKMPFAVHEIFTIQITHFVFTLKFIGVKMWFLNLEKIILRFFQEWHFWLVPFLFPFASPAFAFLDKLVSLTPQYEPPHPPPTPPITLQFDQYLGIKYLRNNATTDNLNDGRLEKNHGKNQGKLQFLSTWAYQNHKNNSSAFRTE